MKSKKKIIGLGGVIVLALIITIIMTRDDSPAPASQDNEPEPASFVYLTDEAVAAPALGHNGDSVWYFVKSDGRLMQQKLSGERSAEPYLIPDRGMPQFVLWPDQGPDIIVGTEQGIFYYDAETAAMTRYPDTLKTINWMPGGQRIAYVWSDDQGPVLSIAKPDLSDFKNITPLPHSGFRVEPAPNSTSSAGSFVLFNPNVPDTAYLAVNNIPGLQELIGDTSIKSFKFSPDAKTAAFIEEKAGRRFLYSVDIATLQVSKIGDLAEGGGFAWGRADTTIFWADSTNTIMARSGSGKQRDILQDVPGAEDVVASEMIPGRSDNELFFVEKQSGRLGRVVFE